MFHYFSYSVPTRYQYDKTLKQTGWKQQVAGVDQPGLEKYGAIYLIPLLTWLPYSGSVEVSDQSQGQREEYCTSSCNFWEMKEEKIFFCVKRSRCVTKIITQIWTTVSFACQISESHILKQITLLGRKLWKVKEETQSTWFGLEWWGERRCCYIALREKAGLLPNNISNWLLSSSGRNGLRGVAQWECSWQNERSGEKITGLRVWPH